jgi:hypothetical protein
LNDATGSRLVNSATEILNRNPDRPKSQLRIGHNPPKAAPHSASKSNLN